MLWVASADAEIVKPCLTERSGHIEAEILLNVGSELFSKVATGAGSRCRTDEDGS